MNKTSAMQLTLAVLVATTALAIPVATAQDFPPSLPPGLPLVHDCPGGIGVGEGGDAPDIVCVPYLVHECPGGVGVGEGGGAPDIVCLPASPDAACLLSDDPTGTFPECYEGSPIDPVLACTTGTDPDPTVPACSALFGPDGPIQCVLAQVPEGDPATCGDLSALDPVFTALEACQGGSDPTEAPVCATLFGPDGVLTCIAASFPNVTACADLTPLDPVLAALEACQGGVDPSPVPLCSTLFGPGSPLTCVVAELSGFPDSNPADCADLTPLDPVIATLEACAEGADFNASIPVCSTLLGPNSPLSCVVAELSDFPDGDPSGCADLSALDPVIAALDACVEGADFNASLPVCSALFGPNSPLTCVVAQVSDFPDGDLRECADVSELDPVIAAIEACAEGADFNASLPVCSALFGPEGPLACVVTEASAFPDGNLTNCADLTPLDPVITAIEACQDGEDANPAVPVCATLFAPDGPLSCVVGEVSAFPDGNVTNCADLAPLEPVIAAIEACRDGADDEAVPVPVCATLFGEDSPFVCILDEVSDFPEGDPASCGLAGSPLEDLLACAESADPSSDACAPITGALEDLPNIILDQFCGDEGILTGAGPPLSDLCGGAEPPCDATGATDPSCEEFVEQVVLDVLGILCVDPGLLGDTPAEPIVCGGEEPDVPCGDLDVPDCLGAGGLPCDPTGAEEPSCEDFLSAACDADDADGAPANEETFPDCLVDTLPPLGPDVEACLTYVTSDDPIVYLAAWQDCYASITGQQPPPGCDNPAGIPDGLIDCLPSTSSPPTVSVTASAASINEGDALDFTFTRSATAGVLDVACTYSGAATPGTDFTPGVCAVRFNDGSNKATLRVLSTIDNADEPDESLTVQVADGDAYDAGSPASASTIIKNVVAPLVSISASSTAVDEGTSVVYTVTREAQPGQAMDKSRAIRVGLSANGANSPDDFQPAVPDSIVIDAKQTQATFLVENIQDTAPDGSKPLTVVLLDGPTYLLGSPASIVVDLLDDDMVSVDVRVADGLAAESAGTADPGVFQVRRDGPTGSALTVDIQLTSTSACGSDFVLSGAIASCSATTVTIPAGASLAEVVVSATDDALREGPRAVTLEVKPKAGVYDVPSLGRRGTIDVQDNDIPVVTLSSLDQVATEDGQDAAAFRITRTAVDQASALTVQLVYSGTAAADDFSAPASVTIPAGSLSTDVSVVPTADQAVEAGETVIVALVQPAGSSPAYQASGNAITVATITDDDVDTDGDGVVDAIDNCATLANGDQGDNDGDKSGDLCDTDNDNDGLPDAQEAGLGTDPLAADSDRDGLDDGVETAAGTNPLDATSPNTVPRDVVAEPRGTGVTITWTVPSPSGVDRYLVFRASTPTLVGTVPAVEGRTQYEFVDTSVFEDGNHTYHVQGMLPSETDQSFNASRVGSSEEQLLRLCDAFTADADGDEMCDIREAQLRTNPALEDTDGDGATDQAEFEAGTDPLEPNTIGPVEVKLAREVPFWVGLLLAIATIAMLLVGVGWARRRSPVQDFATEASSDEGQDPWLPEAR